MKAFTQIRAIGWAVVEVAFLLIVLCLLLDIVIGAQADSFVSKVAKNATAFLQSLPPGVVVGVAAVAVVYGVLRTRVTR
ncbi:MAG TPA: hypothetical protein VGR70_17575 [Stellaceae bacterium]|nr:hypothetical protein [Stellaceae bacterium]